MPLNEALIGISVRDRVADTAWQTDTLDSAHVQAIQLGNRCRLVTAFDREHAQNLHFSNFPEFNIFRMDPHLISDIGRGAHEECPGEGSIASRWDVHVIFAGALNIPPAQECLFA